MFGLVLAVCVASRPAHAAGWADFEALFQAFPCPDGWMACVVAEAPLTPEPALDASGLPMPAGARVSWFSLEPTRAFSPFTGLSAYAGAPATAAVEHVVADANTEEAAAQQAAAEAERQRQQAEEAERVAREQADAAARERQAAVERAREEAAAAKRAQEQASQASEAEKQRLMAEADAARKRAEDAEKARLRAEAEERQRQEVARLEAERKAKADEEARARLAAAEEARRKAEAEAAEKSKVASTPAVAEATVVTRPPPVEDGTCDDLTRIEPLALMGQLSAGQITCLDAKVTDPASKQTDKNKFSRYLVGNAYAKGDKASYEKLVKRHLEEIDSSDPDMCYKYALHLSKQGTGAAPGVIRWSETALENRSVWTGDTYTSRVFSLYKFRSAAAQALWQKAETAYAADANDPNKATVEKWRNVTKTYAREWFEYAKVSGKDSTQALQVCMSAAGTKDFCEGA